MRAERETALATVVKELERRFGPGIVYRLSHAKPKVGTIALASGSLGLDQATGIGGIPRGRITEILGNASCGKTSLAYHILANAQSGGGMAAFVDAAQMLDVEAMLAFGVNIDDLIIAVPVDLSEALEIAEILARSHALDAIVLALDFSPSRKADHLMAEELRKLNVTLIGSPTAIVFLNEGTAPRGPLPFYASLRIALSPLRAIRQPGGDIAGLRVQADVIKNKLALPGGKAEFVIRNDGGIHRQAELFDLALSRSLIETLPIGFVYKGELLGKSRARAIAYLAQNPSLASVILEPVNELPIPSPTAVGEGRVRANFVSPHPLEQIRSQALSEAKNPCLGPDSSPAGSE